MEQTPPPPTDLYMVLGVPRSADEREIKKAYFRRIREHSPETHPEEFKRIRAAYEVLHSASARREYDNMTQYGAELGQHLRAGTEAMDSGDLPRAQEEFQQVLRRKPDLVMARDLLGMAYLNNNQPREALVHFKLAIEQADRCATYHLHMGYAHYALDEYQAALQSYAAACAIDPGEQRVRVALADCYTAMERYDEALQELDRAIRNPDALDVADLVFFLRRVQIQLLRERVDLAETEIDRIYRILPADAELRRYVAQKLSALAAQLFRLRRSADGNRIVARVDQLRQAAAAPERRRRSLVLPARITRRLGELSAEARAQIVKMARRPAPHMLTHGVWGTPIGLMLVALLCLGGAVAETLTARTAWRGNTYVLMSALLLLGPVLLLHAAARLLRVLRSPAGRFTTISPLYLIQVNLDRLVGWPLLHLHDVSMTHHLQNGVYQYTAVRADFAGTPVMITIRGQQAAVDWAQALLDARHRCLGLLSVGMLDEEEDVDLLGGAGAGPAAAVPPHPPARLLLSYAAAVFMGMGLLMGGTHHNARIGEEYAWQQATLYPRAFSFRHYVLSYPEGRHAAQARLLLASVYEQAQLQYQAQARGAPGVGTLVDVLDALREAPSAEVVVRYTPTLAVASASERTMALSPFQSRRREARCTQALAVAFSQVLPADVFSLGGPPHGGERRYHRHRPVRAVPPVTFDVAYEISAQRDGGPPELQVSFVLTVSTPRSAVQRTPYVLKLVSRPTAGHSLGTGGDEDDEIMATGAMVDAAFAEFAQRVAQEFGVSLAPAEGAKVLPHDVRALLREFQRRPPPHPEVR